MAIPCQIPVQKPSQKLTALSLVAYQLDFNQIKLLMSECSITSQFSYTPVVWMFHSSKQNQDINCMHERALRVVYNDYNSSFDELLETLVRFMTEPSKTGNRDF